MLKTTLMFFLLLVSLSAWAESSEHYDRHHMPYCYDYGCKTLTTIDIDDATWYRIRSFFDPVPASPAAERQAMSWAIGVIEETAGRQTPTWKDKGKNPVDIEPGGQLDCVDESTNTDHFLRLLEQEGLLHWHRVVEIAHRLGFIDQHYSAQVEELATGKRYVIDSWFLDNGQPAFVQDIEEWKSVTSLFSRIIRRN